MAKEYKRCIGKYKTTIIIKETGYGMNSEMIGESLGIRAKTIDKW